MTADAPESTLPFRAYVQAHSRPRTGRKLMKLHKRHAILLVVMLAALAAVSYALAAGGSGKFDESLSGYQEDPLTSRPPGTAPSGPSSRRMATRSTTGCRTAALEGNMHQAHIHFGGAYQSGGISVFLCTNLGNWAGGHARLCPAARQRYRNDHRGQRDRAGPDRGSRRAARRVVEAMKAGVTYVNVHVACTPAARSGPSWRATKATTTS